MDCIASIVIYRNPPETLRKAAESFLNTNLRVKLYAVDNSPNPSLKSAFEGLPVIYLFSENNVGYGRAHNQVINNIGPCKYYLILNPDVFIPKGVIEELIKFMDAHPGVGMVCPKVLNEDGTIQYLNKRNPTVLDLFLRRFLPKQLKPIFRRRLDYYEMKDMGYDSIYDVPFISGAFMFCRASVLKEAGGFDPRYFLYFEDADLSRKIQEYGYRTVYYPYVSVNHSWERASHKSVRMALVLIANGIRYFNKWGWKLF